MYSDKLGMQREELIQILQDFKTELKTEISEIRKDLDEFKTEIRKDLDEFKTEIRGDIARLDKKVNILGDELSKTKDTINSFIKSDATGIEHEIGETFKSHFSNIIETVVYDRFPVNQLYDCKGNLITDLDFAAFIKLQDNQIIHFVVIEAKHKITREKIAKKLYQIHKILHWIKEMKAYDKTKCKGNFQRMLTALNKNNMCLEDITQDNILFYVGGPNWSDTSAHELVKQIQKDNEKDSDKKLFALSKELVDQYKFKVSAEEFYETLLHIRHKIGIIKPSGQNYVVHDKLLPIQKGGRKGQRKSYPMINRY